MALDKHPRVNMKFVDTKLTKHSIFIPKQSSQLLKTKASQ